jgi:hypothetical protein
LRPKPFSNRAVTAWAKPPGDLLLTSDYAAKIKSFRDTLVFCQSSPASLVNLRCISTEVADHHHHIMPAVVAYASSKPATTSQALPLIDLCIVVTAGEEGLGRGVLVG